jgi:hypothetical protein
MNKSMKRRNELRQLIRIHDYSIYEVKIVKEKRLCQKTHNREEAFGMDGPSLTERSKKLLTIIILML